MCTFDAQTFEVTHLCPHARTSHVICSQADGPAPPAAAPRRGLMRLTAIKEMARRSELRVQRLRQTLRQQLFGAPRGEQLARPAVPGRGEEVPVHANGTLPGRRLLSSPQKETIDRAGELAGPAVPRVRSVSAGGLLGGPSVAAMAASPVRFIVPEPSAGPLTVNRSRPRAAQPCSLPHSQPQAQQAQQAEQEAQAAAGVHPALQKKREKAKQSPRPTVPASWVAASETPAQQTPSQTSPVAINASHQDSSSFSLPPSSPSSRQPLPKSTPGPCSPVRRTHEAAQERQSPGLPHPARAISPQQVGLQSVSSQPEPQHARETARSAAQAPWVTPPRAMRADPLRTPSSSQTDGVYRVRTASGSGIPHRGVQSPGQPAWVPVRVLPAQDPFTLRRSGIDLLVEHENSSPASFGMPPRRGSMSSVALTPPHARGSREGRIYTPSSEPRTHSAAAARDEFVARQASNMWRQSPTKARGGQQERGTRRRSSPGPPDPTPDELQTLLTLVRQLRSMDAASVSESSSSHSRHPSQRSERWPSDFRSDRYRESERRRMDQWQTQEHRLGEQSGRDHRLAGGLFGTERHAANVRPLNWHRESERRDVGVGGYRESERALGHQWRAGLYRRNELRRDTDQTDPWRVDEHRQNEFRHDAGRTDRWQADGRRQGEFGLDAGQRAEPYRRTHYDEARYAGIWDGQFEWKGTDGPATSPEHTPLRRPRSFSRMGIDMTGSGDDMTLANRRRQLSGSASMSVIRESGLSFDDLNGEADPEAGAMAGLEALATTVSEAGATAAQADDDALSDPPAAASGDAMKHARKDSGHESRADDSDEMPPHERELLRGDRGPGEWLGQNKRRSRARRRYSPDGQVDME